MSLFRSPDLIRASFVVRFSAALGCVLCSCYLVAAPNEPLDEPKIVRDVEGIVTISTTSKDGVVRYTIDGSDPVQRSGPYLAPIELAHGGTVKARTFSADRKQNGNVSQVKFDPLPGAKVAPSTLVTCTQDRDWPVYDWAKRHAAVSESVRERQPKLIFIGDSITQMFGGEPHDRSQPGKDVWDKYYGHRNAVNLGFGYDYIENTLWRLRHGELTGAKAQAVVIHIGTNNLGKNTSDEIAVGVRTICDEVHRQLPDARIVLMAILPRGAKPDATRAKLNEVNKLLAKLDGQNGVVFMDIGASFLQPDGSLPGELMGDYLHPSAKGYEIWAEKLEPTLKKLLGE